MGLSSLLQGIFSTQVSNPGLLHCRQILYHLIHQGQSSPNHCFYSLNACVLSRLSCVQLFSTPWTVACQVPLSTEFSRQYYSGLPCPSPGDVPNPGIKPRSPALAGEFFTTESPEKPGCYKIQKIFIGSFASYLCVPQPPWRQPVSKIRILFLLVTCVPFIFHELLEVFACLFTSSLNHTRL